MSDYAATLRQWLAAGDRGDVESFDRYLHPAVVVHAPLGLSTTSLDAEKAVWLDAKRAIPDLRHEVQETISEGSRVVARVVVTGTLVSEFAGINGNAQTFRIDQAVIAHFRDGLVVEAWEIADTAALVVRTVPASG
jgi:predicted ester cyclase